MTAPPKWLRVLLLILPQRFRDEYREEIFAHVKWLSTRRGRRWPERIRHAAFVILDVLRVAVSERLHLGGTMWSERSIRTAGVAAVLGGGLALAATPFLVIIKYATGWSIIPQPAWTDLANSLLQPMVSFGTPVQLWMLYGAVYSVALILMVIGVIALYARTRRSGTRVWRCALWLLLIGMVMVLIGDALHFTTWHLGGETTPRPGLNAIAGFGMSMTYLGMPIIFLASFALGASALRQHTLPPTFAWLLLVVGPGGAVLTATQVPTLPSGALAIFSVTMMLLGYAMATERLDASRVL